MDALEKGDGKRAFDYINQAIAVRPNLSESHHMKGMVLLAQNDIDGAIACFKTALTINPKNAYSWTSLCDIWTKRDAANSDIARAASLLKRGFADPAVHKEWAKRSRRRQAF